MGIIEDVSHSTINMKIKKKCDSGPLSVLFLFHCMHCILHSTLDIDCYRLYTLTVYIHLPGKAGVTLHVADILL